MTKIRLNVNAVDCEIEAEPWESLNAVLREKVGLTGTKKGCDTGGCGACTVIMNGKAIYSCMMYAMKADGSKIVTIEGLAGVGDLDFVQKAFEEFTAFQCGYCTPGFVISAKSLLERNPDPSEREIREALAGNLCRCTGYTKIVEAVASLRKRT